MFDKLWRQSGQMVPVILTAGTLVFSYRNHTQHTFTDDAGAHAERDLRAASYSEPQLNM